MTSYTCWSTSQVDMAERSWSGHHLAYNFTYAGKCTSATPLFDGTEPTKWTGTDGKQHAPLEAQRASMVALLTAVASKPEAKLAGTFSDLIAGPVGGEPPGLGGAMGGGDTNYPNNIDYPTGTSGRGVQVSTLSAADKTLLKQRSKPGRRTSPTQSRARCSLRNYGAEYISK